MPRGEQPASDESRHIDPVYRPSADGTIVVYAGELLLALGNEEHVVPGNLELRLSLDPPKRTDEMTRLRW